MKLNRLVLCVCGILFAGAVSAESPRCTPHFQCKEKWELLAAPDILPSVFGQPGNRTRVPIDPSQPNQYTDLGYALPDEKVDFLVMIVDEDNHVCQGRVVGQENNMVKDEPTLGATVAVAGGGSAGTVDIGVDATMGNGWWAGSWPVTADKAGKRYRFVFSGKVDDVACLAEKHVPSDDPQSVEMPYYKATVVVPKVELVKVPTENGNSPRLADGRICINAQPKYKKALWKVSIEPAKDEQNNDYTAWIDSTASGNGTCEVTLEGAGHGNNQTNPMELKDGDTFLAVGGDQVGAYEITLTHKQFPACKDTDGEKVFRFVLLSATATPPIETGSGGRRYRELDSPAPSGSARIKASTQAFADPTQNTSQGEEISAGMHWADGAGSGAKGEVWASTEPLDANNATLYQGNLRWTIRIKQYRGYHLEASAGPWANLVGLSAKINGIGLSLSAKGSKAVAAWNYKFGFPHVGVEQEAGTVTLNGGEYVPWPNSIVTVAGYDTDDMTAPNTLLGVGTRYPIIGGTLVAVERSDEDSGVLARAEGLAHAFQVEAKDSQENVTQPEIVQ